MAALGASLGAILALCLVVLGFLIHKHYGNSIKRKLGRGLGDVSNTQILKFKKNKGNHIIHIHGNIIKNIISLTIQLNKMKRYCKYRQQNSLVGLYDAYTHYGFS